MIENDRRRDADPRPEPGRARRGAQGGAAGSRRLRPRRRRASGRICSALARTASDADPRLPHRARRRHCWPCSPRARPARSRPSQHTQATYGAVVHNVLSNLIDPRPGEIMLHAASMIHASGTFVLPYWLRGGTCGDPARLRSRFLCRGDRALAARTRSISSRPCCRCCSSFPASRRPISPRSRRSATAPRQCRARCSRKALALWGPVFVQYYGQTEAPIAICRLTKEDHVGASAGAAALLRPAQRRMRGPAGRRGGRGRRRRRAGRDRASRAVRDEGLFRSRADRQAFLPGGWLAPGTSAASTTRAISAWSTAPPT